MGDVLDDTTRRSKRRPATERGTDAPIDEGADADHTTSALERSFEIALTPLSHVESLTMRALDATFTTHGGKSPTTASEAQAIRELEGMRVLLVTVAVFAIVSFPVLFFLPAGTSGDRMLAAIGMLIVASASTSTYVRTLKQHAFGFDQFEISKALLVAAAVPILTLGLGMCTALTGAFALGLLIFSTNAPPRVAFATLATFSLGHATLGALAWAGLVTTTGLGDSVPTPTTEMLFSVVYVEAEYIAAFLLGLVLSRRSKVVLGQLESAVRTSSQREALLREVRADLDRAANLLGPGRFSGQTIGTFVLGDVIGRGGMGEVYAAHRPSDGREAAIKLLQRELLGDAIMVKRFEREAQTVASLATPYVTEILEFGGRDAPIPYIAMERLRGTDLAALLRTKATLPISELLELVDEVSRGLEVAHRAGIVHRDLKPNNLFHAESGPRRVWKILDFGIAKETNAPDHTLTRNQVVGTPQYMAPEQAAGDAPIDRRADVYSLAAIAFRALTGRTVWNRGDCTQVLLAVAWEVPPDPRTLAEMSADVAYVLRIGLAKRAEDRFPNALELHLALEAASRGELANEWRAHATRLIAREPWGSTLRSAG